MEMVPQLLKYNLTSEVTAFSTTRHGGCSEGNYSSFNINEYCGDTVEHTRRNKEALAQELGTSAQRIILPHQTHGIESRRIGGEFFTLPERVQKMILEGVDAVMTDEEGVCIGVSTADCIPVLLYDPEHHAVCAIHAGWRGTAARITRKVIVDMTFHFHTNPRKVKAVIGPGISLDSFEVGQEVYDQFAEASFDMSNIAKLYKKWHINLPLCNKQMLLEAGVEEENIHEADICTMKNQEDFFSARALGTDSGRIYTGIMLNPSR